MNAPGYLPAPQGWPDGPVREYGARDQSSGWSESATIIVACLCGLCAAALAVLVLLDEGAPNPPRSVEVETVVVREVDGTSLPAWRSSLRLTENFHPDNQLNV